VRPHKVSYKVSYKCADSNIMSASRPSLLYTCLSFATLILREVLIRPIHYMHKNIVIKAMFTTLCHKVTAVRF